MKTLPEHHSNRPLRAIVVDDESHARDSLISLISAYCPEVGIIASASSLPEGVSLINDHDFDLLFLDVELPPHGTGFSLLEEVRERSGSFSTIFVTGFSSYAADAFRASAVYFIVKPVDIDELNLAVARVRHLMELQQSHLLCDNIAKLLDSVTGEIRMKPRILVKVRRGYEQLDLAELSWCAGSYQQTEFHLLDGRSIIAQEALQNFEESLVANGFISPKRYTYVNLEAVRSYTEKPGSELAGLTLSCGTHIDVSRRQRLNVRERLKKLY